MLTQALVFLITTLGGLFTLALMLRFMLQTLRAMGRNQLSQFVIALTDFAVRPLRRVIPGWWGLDLATLALAWLVQVLEIWLTLQLKGYEFGPAVGVGLAALALLAAIQLARIAIYIVMAAVILQAVLSWINPRSPLAPLLAAVTRPFLRPFQRLVPPVANVDLSPIFVLITCQLLLIVPLAWLDAAVGRLL